MSKTPRTDAAISNGWIKEGTSGADFVRRMEMELNIKSQFLNSRQCPDHAGKWERGRCFQCELENLIKLLPNSR